MTHINDSPVNEEDHTATRRKTLRTRSFRRELVDSTNSPPTTGCHSARASPLPMFLTAKDCHEPAHWRPKDPAPGTARRPRHRATLAAWPGHRTGLHHAAPKPPSSSSTAPSRTPPASPRRSPRYRKLATRFYAPANPLRGLSIDTAYLKSFLATVSGPIVLVGHSYGGAVITDAAPETRTSRRWSTWAAYALADGEKRGDRGDAGWWVDPPPAAPGLSALPGRAAQDADASIRSGVLPADLRPGRAGL